MKKTTYLLLSLATIIITITSCKKNDTTAPVITLKGNNPDVVVWGSSANYVDPGATVVDDMDGTLSIDTITGTVNMFAAGNYTLTYTATDAASNQGTATRTVVVDAAPYLNGHFTVNNYIITTFDATYIDTLAITTTNNTLTFKHFATYQNAKVTATVAGTTITIPQQTMACGLPTHTRTFSGSGTFANDSVFTINYTIADSTLVYSGHGNYVRN
ncbi:MAG: immunoglobulin-like domain-containing protein [Bacteroidota bacterium]